MLYNIAIPFLIALAIPAAPDSTAKIADLAWLEGSWEGQGIAGAPAVEVYSRAADGTMVGHFRQLNANGKVMFYEIITIEETGGSLSYNVKHFNADLTGWEEKGEVRRFPLSAIQSGRWEFSGVTYERTGRNTMIASVAAKGADGSQETLQFRFRRKSR
ncbi:MAG: DUF6265 family protein [Sphingorhabdus sp.]